MNSRARILLAEDNQVIRDLLIDLMLAEGLDCDYAENGAEAVEKLREKKYDLLITDYRMPKMNGIELLDWCHHNSLSLPVIFLTADFLLPQERILISKMTDILLSKPICLDQFISTIHSSLENTTSHKCLA